MDIHLCIVRLMSYIDHLLSLYVIFLFDRIRDTNTFYDGMMNLFGVNIQSNVQEPSAAVGLQIQLPPFHEQLAISDSACCIIPNNRSKSAAIDFTKCETIGFVFFFLHFPVCLPIFDGTT